jgi:hypothetical protein
MEDRAQPEVSQASKQNDTESPTKSIPRPDVYAIPPNKSTPETPHRAPQQWWTPPFFISTAALLVAAIAVWFSYSCSQHPALKTNFFSPTIRTFPDTFHNPTSPTIQEKDQIPKMSTEQT